MPRSVKPWVGDNDDTAIPPRVRARVFERFDGRCHKCSRKIAAGERWTCEHMIAITNGGKNEEANLNVTCDWCLPEKNREDAAIKRKGTKVRYRNLGIRAPSKLHGPGFPKAEPQRSATKPLRPKYEIEESTK